MELPRRHRARAPRSPTTRPPHEVPRRCARAPGLTLRTWLLRSLNWWGTAEHHRERCCRSTTLSFNLVPSRPASSTTRTFSRTTSLWVSLLHLPRRCALTRQLKACLGGRIRQAAPTGSCVECSPSATSPSWAASGPPGIPSGRAFLCLFIRLRPPHRQVQKPGTQHQSLAHSAAFVTCPARGPNDFLSSA